MHLSKKKDKSESSGSGFWRKIVGGRKDSDRSRPGSRLEINTPTPQLHSTSSSPSIPIGAPFDAPLYRPPFGNISQPVLRPVQDISGPRSNIPPPPQQPHFQRYPQRNDDEFQTPQLQQGLQPYRSPGPQRPYTNTLQLSTPTPYIDFNGNYSTSTLPVPQYSLPERRSPSPMRPLASPPIAQPTMSAMQFGQSEENYPPPQMGRNAYTSMTAQYTPVAVANGQGQRYPRIDPSRPPHVASDTQNYPPYRSYNQRGAVPPPPQPFISYSRPGSPLESLSRYDPGEAPYPVPQYLHNSQRKIGLVGRMPTTRRQQRMSMEVPAAAYVIVGDDDYVQPYDAHEPQSFERPRNGYTLGIATISNSDTDEEDEEDESIEAETNAMQSRRGFNSSTSSVSSIDAVDEADLKVDFNGKWINDPKAPAWYIKDPEEVPRADPKYLCGTCRRINTSVLYQQKSTDIAPQPEEFIRLGTLADFLIKFKCCGLCHFFMRLIAFEVATTKLGPGFTTSDMAGAFFGEYLSDFQNQGTEYSLWPIQFMDSYNVPTIYLCRGPPPNPSADLAVLARPSYLFGWRQVHSCCRAPNTGRRISSCDSIDFEWIKEMLRLCDERSTGRRLYDTNDVQIRAIDVHRMCIVDLEDGDEYVTLSYVWGEAKQVKLIWETESLLREPRGLLQFWERIPKTIQDAIILTRKIGLDYLWVDALCIMQDDSDDQGRQIRHMGHIYKTSVLTVQARCGIDATHGLPGVQPCSRNVRQMLGLAGKSVVCNTLALPEDDRSKWSTRAWTMQENVLSQRKLIITEQSCQWWCWHTSTVEDLHCRHQYWPVGEPFRSMFFYSTGHDGLEGSTKRQSNFDTFAYLIADYSQRSMKYPSDAENAILGIFDSISGLFDYGFTHGLPDLELLSALLWMPVGGSERRLDSRTGVPLWPSWSWLGWIGHVSYLWANERTMPMTPFGSPLQWRNVDEDGTETWETRTPGTSSRFTRLDDDPWCWNDSLYEGTVRWSANTIGYNTQVIQPGPYTHRLEFRTLCAKFKLSGSPVKRRNIYNFQHDVYEMYVLDSRGFAIGAINIPNPAHFSPSQDHAFAGGVTLHDFIVLSRGSVNNDPRVGLDELLEEHSMEGEIPHLGHKAPSTSIFETDAGSTMQFVDPIGSFDARLYSDKIPYCLYNVLMIERVKDVAFRVAAGRIHVSSFALAEPRMEHVRLE